MAESQEILRGSIGAVIFKNEENGYAVLRLQCEDGQTVTVVGTVPQPVVGETLMVTGRWSNHSSYGKQFEAEFLERLLPTSAKDILRYLSGRAIKGIGPVIANRIVSRFGDDTLKIIETEPEKLAAISGISRAKALAISENYRKQTGMRQLIEFFELHKLPAELAVQLYKFYGETARQQLQQDPYLLTEEELACPFEQADRFALAMNTAPEDERRIEAGILHYLKKARDSGHCYLPEARLVTLSAELLQCKEDTVLIGIERLEGFDRVIRDFVDGVEVIYLPALHEAEIYCTRKLKKMAERSYPLPGAWNTIIRHAEHSSAFHYSETQLQAAQLAVCHGLLLLTGGPGTGKTTTLNAIVDIYEQMGMKCLLAAPTGRAAKRLSDVTGREASTIHRLLEAGIDPHTGKMCFGKDESDPLRADAIIVDEMSMVDLPLLHSLLVAVRSKTRLVLVGDPDQLPPVGPGCPFLDCLQCGILPSVHLTEVFRQAQESLIVLNAHSINKGQLPDLRTRDKDFFFLPCRNDALLKQTVADLVTRRLPENMGIPTSEIQVLSPTKKGAVGTWELNEMLQQQINPPSPAKKEKKFGNFSFREGDRVMQIRNNYDIMWTRSTGYDVGTGIFNGDIGTVEKVDLQTETLTVCFDDRRAEYPFDDLTDLEPAYAITVHKSQGSEYRAAILCAWHGSPYLLSRSVLYTAVTRAKELLIIVGLEDVIRAMTENAKNIRRHSGLKTRLLNS